VSKILELAKRRENVKYKVTITKTSDGHQEYMQVISQDQFSTNIVLIGEFDVKDARIPANLPEGREVR